MLEITLKTDFFAMQLDAWFSFGGVESHFTETIGKMFMPRET